jgi:hypothetical protein
MAIGAVAGTKLYIGGTTGSPDLFVEVGDISSLGNISLQFAQITVESVGSGDSYMLKGTRNVPNLDLTLNRNDTDPGQIALKAASEAVRGTLYWFKIEEADGGESQWQGEVFGYGPNYGSVNDLRSVTTSVSIRPDSLTITLAV